MAEIEQLASTHEALVLLLRNLPRARLIGLMCVAAGIDVSDLGDVRERTPTIELPGHLRRARRGTVDLVLVVHTGDGRVAMLWILEVQLSWDANKR